MSDVVHQVSGLPRLDAGNPNQVYETIMDPDVTLNYIAATLKKSIDAPDDLILAAIGWLARENKLAFDANGRSIKVSLR